MKWQVLMLGLVVFGMVVPTALADDIGGGQPALAEAGPAAMGGTAVTDAELAAADRLRAAYPGVQLYRVGTTLSRVYGRTLAMGDSPDQVGAQFLAENADLFGAEASDLLPLTPVLSQGNQLPMMYDPSTGAYKSTLVYYSQYRDGVPVFRAGIRLLVSNEPGNPLIWAGSNLKRLGDFHPDPNLASTITPSQIAPDLPNITTPEPVIWAGVNEDTLTPRQAVTFEVDNNGQENGKPQAWRYVVDAATGEVLYKESLIHFTDVTGSVHGMATTLPKSDACNPEVDTAMKYAKVAIGGTTVYADASGNFIIPNPGTSSVSVNSYVAGQYFTVDNLQGSEETLTASVTPPGPANFVHNSANTNEQIRSQVNAYIQANMARDWVLTYKPNFPTVATQTDFPLNVNSTMFFYCPGNAWYSSSGSGSLTFCKAGSGYPNTAFSSVVHHEYGHHLCQVAGTGQDQYGEGVGDCVGVCIADDPILGYGFEGNCSAGIRTASNSMTYPCSSDIHTCAQLLSGCIWSTRNQLVGSYPSTYLSILSYLMVNSIPMHAGSGTINPAIYTDWVTLDNNYYGGAHVTQITTGFAAHNMVPADTTPPTPNPMSFASAPAPAGTTSITMTATTATDAQTPPVSYNFDFVSGGAGGTDSGWQSGTSYTDTGLTANTSYTYRVQARDSVATPNVTTYSSNNTTATLIETPTGVTFGAVTSSSIVLNASGSFTNLTTASSGLYFDSTTTGGDTGINAWVNVTTDTATGLSPNASYTFQVKARNQNSVETAYSGTASKVTLANVPTAPTLSSATRTTLGLNVNANGNPASTEFAVQCTAATPGDSTWVGKYVNASGAPSAAAVWRTDAQWATTTVTGLEGCTSYTFAVKARNSESVETAFGAGASLSTSGRQGDLNGDNDVDGEDIHAFVACTIAGGDGCGCANMTVPAFVNCLLDAGTCP
jgi:hypothetical protein